MSRNNRQGIGRRHGFTLVEVMIAAALLSICTAMAMAGFVRVINGTVASVKCSVLHRELRNGLARMSRDVMEAKAIYDYGSGNYLILRKPTATGDIYVYYLIYENRLYRFQSNTAGSDSLGADFSDLKVSYYNLDGDSVTSMADAMLIHLRLAGAVSSRDKVYKDAVETRVRLRNKQV